MPEAEPLARAVDKIVVTDVADAVVAAMKGVAADGIEVACCATADEALRHFADADAALVSTFDERLLEVAEQLQWVHTRSGGVESYLFPAFAASPVIFTCSKPNFGIPGAEFALAAMLMITRRNHLAVGVSKTAYLSGGLDDTADPEDLAGKTVGLLGLGCMGQALAPRAAALGLRVLACTRSGNRGAAGVAEEYDLSRVDTLLGQCDFVAVGLPLTAQTRGMIDADFLSRMCRDAWIIDMSARAALFDYPALVRAIENGRIGGIASQPCGLDPELGMPPIDSDYWQRHNVVVSACRGTSSQQVAAGIGLFVDNLARFRAGEPMFGLVDKQAGY